MRSRFPRRRPGRDPPHVVCAAIVDAHRVHSGRRTPSIGLMANLNDPKELGRELLNNARSVAESAEQAARGAGKVATDVAKEAVDLLSNAVENLKKNIPGL